MAARRQVAGTVPGACIARWLVGTVVVLAMLSLMGCKEQFVGMLNPKGIITYHERKLFFDTLALMLIVVLPVIVMSIAFVYHYQASHHIRDYKPNWSHSYFLETIWWTVPCVIITILAVLTWKKTHELDPYNPIPHGTSPPLLIEAIALPWKWLFIYPAQHIATINYLVLPVNQEVEFWMTTDNVPMSALFIPQLGSQIYAMAGMRTRLHLIGNERGTYDGLNTQYNGAGFSGMHFVVKVVTADEMQQWYADMKRSTNQLSQATYQTLLKPTEANAPTFYAGVAPHLFEGVIQLYLNTFGTVHPRGLPLPQ
ncbi:MAG: cytochrome ubiquinol oxidase subunit II [Gammaproteobacteria bacterium RIFCSPHIGHO2_12_FULL_42_13]|nr:MAG: cytochrome ubiquinol oxidase subunit II [Gammaproteobacteria bacterium RIFCSPHIGHO2_12_FULL_42_13]